MVAIILKKETFKEQATKLLEEHKGCRYAVYSRPEKEYLNGRSAMIKKMNIDWETESLLIIEKHDKK